MKTRHGSLGAVAALLLLMTGCASTEFVAVNGEPGFYSGYGTGSTEATAQQAAFDDLVYTTFVQSGAVPRAAKSRTVLSDDMKAAVAALAPKPYLSEKKGPTSFSAVYRIKQTDWDTAEAARLASLQASLGPKLAALSAPGSATHGARLLAAAALLKDLDRLGVSLSLRTAGAGSPLFAEAVNAWVKGLTARAAFRFAPAEGNVAAGQPVKVFLLNPAGQPLTGLDVTALWATDNTSAPALNLVTGADGSVAAPYPDGADFQNVPSVLRVSSKAASLKSEATYRNSIVLADVKTPEARVEGGTFAIGSVKQDRRAGSKEKPRTVTVAPFFIDTVPVTNAQYRSFLESTAVPRDQWPDFLAEGKLAAPNQPVVGVTLAEAQAYAVWVSGILGVTKRLPTEAEYEVAARAGQLVIYPWGDQPPTDGVRANYAGNKKFDATSPVGAFANGANPLGLFDLVGNVWEWTTSGPDAQITADPNFVIIKGGSWLDGPGELRISNRRAVDPAESASDLGFRLVREDKQ